MALLASRICDLTTSVFAEFSALANRHGAVNLGQGFPDFDGPEEIRELAIRAMRDGMNQYAPSSGVAALKEAVAAHALRFYDQAVEPATEVVVTSGATEALFDATLGLVEPGDEVVVFEPYYDSYVVNVKMAGAVVRYVALSPPDEHHSAWWFDPAELCAAFSDKTKLVLINTPHNPTGKVFTHAELAYVAGLCVRHDAVVVTDEVYEHIVFEPARHIRMATLPGMAERTITIGSAGKSFSFTGWKVGWAIAKPDLLAAVFRTHQFVTFAVATPFQQAIAAALALPDGYYAELRRMYTARRALLLDTLGAAGLRPIAPEGSYFAIAQIEHLGFATDEEFCRHLTCEVGVAAIPTSAFYCAAHREQGYKFARFAFCKREETLLNAKARLSGRGIRHGQAG